MYFLQFDCEVGHVIFIISCKLKWENNRDTWHGWWDDGDYYREQEEKRICQEKGQICKKIWRTWWDYLTILWSGLTLSSDILESTTDNERNSLEDILFADEDNFVEPEEEALDEKFMVALRLSPRPEHLVKGYEFKMLNK